MALAMVFFSFGASAQCDSVTLSLYDSYGDGGGSITIDGTTYTLASGSAESFSICVDLSACTDVVYAFTGFLVLRNSWDIVDASGAVLASGGDASGQACRNLRFTMCV